MSYTISVSGLIPLKSSIHRRTAQRSMKVSPPLSLFFEISPGDLFRIAYSAPDIS